MLNTKINKALKTVKRSKAVLWLIPLALLAGCAASIGPY